MWQMNAKFMIKSIITPHGGGGGSSSSSSSSSSKPAPCAPG